MVRIPTTRSPIGPPRHCRRIGTVAELAARVGLDLDQIPAEIQGIEIYTNPRLRRAFGRARRQRHILTATETLWIELFPGVLSNPAQCRETLGHEIAHHCAGLDAGHGPKWKRWARRLGIRPERCGDSEAARSVGLSARRRQRRRHIYRCERCGHEIARARPFKLGAIYTHRGCGGRFLDRRS